MEMGVSSEQSQSSWCRVQSAIRSVYWSRWFSYNNFFSFNVRDTSTKHSFNAWALVNLSIQIIFNSHISSGLEWISMGFFLQFWRWRKGSRFRSERGAWRSVMVEGDAAKCVSKENGFLQPWWHKLLIHFLSFFVYYNEILNIYVCNVFFFLGGVVMWLHFFGWAHAHEHMHKCHCSRKMMRENEFYVLDLCVLPSYLTFLSLSQSWKKCVYCVCYRSPAHLCLCYSLTNLRMDFQQMKFRLFSQIFAHMERVSSK